MIDPITASIAAYLVPLFTGFFVRLVKHRQSKKRLRAQQASDILKAEQEQQRKAEEKEEWKAYIQREAQKAKAWEIKQAEEKEACRRAQEREREWEAKEERDKQAQRAGDKDAKNKQQKREAEEQAQREDKLEALNEKLRLMDEELEREKRERKEGEKKAEMKTKFLAQALQYAFSIFKDLMLRQQSRRCSCGIHPCRCNQMLKQQERQNLLAHFEMVEGGDDDLLNIFGESYIPLQDTPLAASPLADNRGNSNARNMALLELPDQLPSGFEEDILSMAMTAINENGQGATLLELDYQLFDDFEDDDIVSSAITDATEAKDKGNVYFKEQKLEEAIKWYSKSIDMLPIAAAYCNRAMAYLKLNKFIEVEKDCSEAIRMDDQYLKAYARRAIARTKLGSNLEGALADVEIALKLDRTNQEMVELYAELVSLKAEAKEKGNAYFKERDYELAILSYTESIDQFPTVVAYSNRAMAYLLIKGGLEEAEKDCTKALKIDNQYFKAYARRAIARFKIGHNLEGALKDVEAALQLEPDNQEMKKLQVDLKQLL